MIRKYFLIGCIWAAMGYGSGAYGSYQALKHFDSTHAVIIIPSKDGAFIAHDVDAERAGRHGKIHG